VHNIKSIKTHVRSTMIPTLAEFFVHLFVNFFGNNMIKIQGRGIALLLLLNPHTHCIKTMAQVYHMKRKVFTLCCQLYSTSSTNQQLFVKNL